MQPPPAVRIVGSFNALLGVGGLIEAVVGGVAAGVVGAQGNWHLLGVSDEARYWTVAIGGVLWVLLAAIVQTASGVGLLRTRPWSLAVTRGHAAYGVTCAIVYGFLHFTIYYQPYVQLLTTGGRQLSAGLATLIVIAAGIAAVLLMLVYPILVLLVLRGPKVQTFFAEQAETPHADDLRWVPQFTLRRLMVWMAISSLFCLIVGNAVAGRHWAIGVSLAMIAVVAAFILYGAAFFVVWVASLIWQPRSPFAATASPPAAPPPLPPTAQTA